MLRSKSMALAVSLTLVGVVVGGCDAIINLFPTTNNESGKSQLLPFGSEKEFSDYLRDQITRRNDSLNTFDRQFEEAVSADGSANGGAGGDAAAPSAPGSGQADLTSADSDSGSDFSGTTLQESGVDEADVVKTDGNYLYVLTTEWPDSTLRIVDVSDPAAMAEVAAVPLTGYGQDFYLDGDTIVALTSNGGGFYYFGGGGIAIDVIAVSDVAADPVGTDTGGVSDGVEPTQTTPPSGGGVTNDDSVADDREPAPDAVDGLIAPDMQYERPRFTVTVIDVTERTAPAIASTTKFDGTISSSRMIDGVLHVVAANYQSYYYDVMPLLGAPEFDAAAVNTEEVLPRFTHTDADGTETSGDVVTWEQLYRPTDPDGFGIVYVASVDIDADAAFSAVGVVAEPGLIYSSTQALYLTDTQYDFFGGQRTTTDVYKLAYVDRGATPVATGTVQGRILNQYSMGEYEDNLRVATTTDATFGIFGQVSPATNHVFVLGESDGSLNVIGSVEGIAPRETIQAARFIGDRGFVVTFEQIDPLFTLDLSNPTNPRVVGELKVPGFSTFLVPIDADHLLAVGQHVPPPGEFGAWGVQLSIFDVTDFSQPALMDSVTIGDDTGAYSEALYNPKAFTYFAERGRVALPVSIYENYFGIEGDAGVSDVDIDADDNGTSSGSSGGGSSGSAGSADAPPPDMVDDPIEGELVEIEPYVPGGFEGVVVYDVSVESGLTEVGRLSTRFPEAGLYWASYTRGVFIGDELLAVTDNGVRAAPVSNLESDQVELVFDRSSGDKGDIDETPASSGGSDGVDPGTTVTTDGSAE